MIPKGRFKKPATDFAQCYGESISSDWRLYLYEYLVKKGTPFREAHEVIGKIVSRSVANQIPLNEVPLAELKEFSLFFDSDVATIFDVGRALAKRNAIGAPSRENIGNQITHWRAHLVLTDESG